MREARLIGGVNLVDRAFNKKGRVECSELSKATGFYEDFCEIPPRGAPAASYRGDTLIRLFPSFNAYWTFIYNLHGTN